MTRRMKTPQPHIPGLVTGETTTRTTGILGVHNQAEAPVSALLPLLDFLGDLQSPGLGLLKRLC